MSHLHLRNPLHNLDDIPHRIIQGHIIRFRATGSFTAHTKYADGMRSRPRVAELMVFNYFFLVILSML